MPERLSSRAPELRASGIVAAATLVSLVALAEQPASGPRVDALATLKPAASLQGIDVTADGTVYFTGNADDAVMRYTPDGKLETFATLPIHPHGILVTTTGFVVTGQTNRRINDSSQPPAEQFANLDGRLLVLDRQGAVIKSIPIGAATFPNGIARLNRDVYLIADSLAGVIWRADIEAGTVTPWSRDSFLHADPKFPGANGIKIHDGWVYASNTVKARIGRVRLGNDGRPEGVFTTFGSAPRVDELTIADDGTIYAASHGAMTRISPGGETTTVFETVEGGSSLALALDQKSIYVLTDGAFVDGVRGETRLLRIWFDKTT